MVEGRCRGRLSFLAPVVNFADFGDDRVFGFRGRVGESIPKDRVGVEVSVRVQHFAVIAKGSFVESPPDEIRAGVRAGPVLCGLRCRDQRDGSS